MDEQANDPNSAPMFLVERYAPGIDERGARALASSLERAARELSASGTPVGHVGSFLMPADQVVFSFMTGADEAAVRAANARVAVPLDRIAAAISVGPGAASEGDR